MKVLIEGEASLFGYRNGHLLKYFYSKNSLDIIPLIYKTYKTNDNKIAKNQRYKQQLLNNLKCEGISISEIKNLNYTKGSLGDFFLNTIFVVILVLKTLKKNRKKIYSTYPLSLV